MPVTPWTWIVAVVGLVLMGLLFVLQAIAVSRPRDAWTVKRVYGGDPEATDPRAYFAFHQGLARADVFFWGPLQFAASIGMLLGHRWGFLLGLAAAVPYLYSAFVYYVWDRDLGVRERTFTYWVVVWAMWPAYGLIEFAYCFRQLL